MDSHRPHPTGISTNGARYLALKYAAKGGEGEPLESPDALFSRVARAVAAAEARFPGGSPTAVAEALQLMSTLRFLPNGPALAGAGRAGAQLASCFVVPVQDTLAGLFDAVRLAALVHQGGGGTGFSFSNLRPAGDPVSSGQGRATGPVPALAVFDRATEFVKNGGRRRGANMVVLRVDHPDVEAFVAAKRVPSALCNMNLSVGMTDAFLEAVEANGEIDLLNPRTGRSCGRRRARALMDAVVEAAWRNGEPGVLFLDTIERANPTPQLGTFAATNCCGETPLLPFESSPLGSLDLSRFTRGSPPSVDWPALGQAVRTAVRFLDDLVEVDHAPNPAFREATLRTRKIGLGVMGWADLLVLLDLPYGSPGFLALADRLMGFVARHARAASVDLARERGPFPAFAGSALERRGGPPQRNATLTTIAPTGGISAVAGCTGGIEPLFGVAFERRLKTGERFVEIDRRFLDLVMGEPWFDEGLLERVARSGRLGDVDGIPEAVKRRFLTCHEVPPARQLLVQAAFQRHTDNAISKTVNFPAHATPAEVEAVVRLAWRSGCKGVTVYRDGSREEQTIRFGAEG